jgi:hypothetical protein
MIGARRGTRPVALARGGGENTCEKDVAFALPSGLFELCFSVASNMGRFNQGGGSRGSASRRTNS